MEEVECVVAGAGVIGLAVARRLALAGHEVLVIEAEDAIGTHTSSRNSEVIHAGIYYKRGSAMARHCVAGRHALYSFCHSHGVPHRNCGKLIVATNDEEAGRLPAIAAGAAANGADDLRLLSRQEAQALEPALHCSAALLSPSTGIIDSHAYMLALQGEAEAHGAMLAFLTPIERGAVEDGRTILQTGGPEAMTLACRIFVNAAGHGAPGLAARMDGFPRDMVPQAYFARGNYFSLTGRAPFTRLIYPVPVPGGLGTHLTLDMGGAARFGPDVEWIDGLDYRVDPARGEPFYKAVRRYWPDLPDGALAPSYAGIRPKIVPPAVANQDFSINGPDRHGIAGQVHLFGIESPGLTASLSIADEVAALLGAGKAHTGKAHAGEGHAGESHD
jgi:L-2-hydroxyglutarate oxidase LhgO